jgi:hypothetical protein
MVPRNINPKSHSGDEMNSELKSVSARIGDSIVGFYQHRLAVNLPEFQADDLRRWVQLEVGRIAPGSADRILRAKRQSGALNYTILSRSQSLYRFDAPVAADGVVGIQSTEAVAA